MPRDWRAAVAEMSNVQRMMHLAYRLDMVDEERVRADLLRLRRRAYEDELTAQAAHVGCPGRRGALGNNASLSALAEASAEDAASIVNTYNYDLAAAIRAIAADTPTANRNTYAKRLSEWDAKRSALRAEPVAQYTELSARSQAQQDFYTYNAAIIGKAELHPTSAQCPVCRGWVARGEVPLREAEHNPPPYHFRCVPPGYEVLMADGTKTAIEAVAPGAEVATRQGTCRVRQVFQRHTAEAVYRLYVGGRELRVTGDHPVLSAHGWIAARDLRVGDLIVTVADHVTVERIEVEDYHGDVFNLETEHGEYIVAGVVVHNCPHYWLTRPEQVSRNECPLLWMGA